MWIGKERKINGEPSSKIKTLVCSSISSTTSERRQFYLESRIHSILQHKTVVQKESNAYLNLSSGGPPYLTPMMVIDGGAEISMWRESGAFFAVADGKLSAIDVRVILADVA